MKSILELPLKSFEDFAKWFEAEPVWHKIQIETVTVRDKGERVKGLINNKASLKDIYEIWYLRRRINCQNEN